MAMIQVSKEEVKSCWRSSALTREHPHRVVCPFCRHIFPNSQDQLLSEWESGHTRLIFEQACERSGKGNIVGARPYVDDMVKLASLGGSVNSIRQTSPLTAVIFSW